MSVQKYLQNNIHIYVYFQLLQNDSPHQRDKQQKKNPTTKRTVNSIQVNPHFKSYIYYKYKTNRGDIKKKKIRLESMLSQL